MLFYANLFFFFFGGGVSIYLNVLFLILRGFLHINYKMGYFLQWRTLFVEGKMETCKPYDSRRLQDR